MFHMIEVFEVMTTNMKFYLQKALNFDKICNNMVHQNQNQKRK